MDKDMQNKLIEILTSIQSAVGAAKDFTLSQLPEVAQSYVMFGRVYASTVMCLWLLCLAIGLAIVIRGRHAVGESRVKEEMRVGPGAINEYRVYDGFGHYSIGGAISLLSLMGAFMGIRGFLMVWIAPKVWLLNKIAEMVSGR